MLAEDPNMAATPVTLNDEDAAAIARFSEAIGAFTRGAASLDAAAAQEGVEAVGRVAASAQAGGTGFGFSSWQAVLRELPELGRSLLTIEGDGQQLTLTLDSLGQCAGGAWIHESEQYGPGAAMFTVVGGALHVERPVSCVVPLQGPVSGWTDTPAFQEQPPEGSETLWGSGSVIAGVGAAAALAGAAAAAKRFRDAKAAAGARAAAEKAAAEKAAAEKAAAEKAAAERAAASLPPPPRPKAPEKQWFYTRAGAPEGPVPESEFLTLVPGLPHDTMVWNQDLPDWKPLSETGLAVPPAQKWELAVTAGPASGKFFSVTSDMKVGRSTDCTVCLSDPMASRVHALIVENPDGFWIADNHSSNGTLVNGVRLEQAARLSNGDVIRMGDSEVIFQPASHAPSPAGSPMLSTVVIPPSQAVAPVAPVESATLQTACPRCGSSYKPGDRFCENCGQRL